MKVSDLEKLVHQVTLRAYCRCGDAHRSTSDLEGAIDNLVDFWSQHAGLEHGPVDPAEAARARRIKGKLSTKRVV